MALCSKGRRLLRRVNAFTTMDNTQTAKKLFKSGKLRVASLPTERLAPLLKPSLDRARGMLVGLAIGDALGNTTESLNANDRRRSHGEIRDYLPNARAGGERVGMPSDDTQLAAWLLESLLERGGLDVEDVAKRYSSRRIFGIGDTMRAFLVAYRAGTPLWSCGQPSAGNGALMRVAAVAAYHLPRASSTMLTDALLASALTHNDPTSNAACVAFTVMLCELAGMNSPPAREWWVARFVELARPMEGPARLKGRVPDCRFEGSLCDFLEQIVQPAIRSHKPLRELLNSWHSAAFLLETVPSVLAILAWHAADPETALVRAVNDTWDNDTIAAIVGAAIGSLHGELSLPGRWRDGLSGCTESEDDGRLFDLLSQLDGKIGRKASTGLPKSG